MRSLDPLLNISFLSDFSDVIVMRLLFAKYLIFIRLSYNLLCTLSGNGDCLQELQYVHPWKYNCWCTNTNTNTNKKTNTNTITNRNINTNKDTNKGTNSNTNRLTFANSCWKTDQAGNLNQWFLIKCFHAKF